MFGRTRRKVRRRRLCAVAVILGLSLLAGLPVLPMAPSAVGGVATVSASGPSSVAVASNFPSTTGPTVVPPPIPNGSLATLNVTVTNPGSNATGTYEQPVGINSSLYADAINANWSNAYVVYADNQTPIYAWIQSGASNTSFDTVVWLRLDSIPAASSVNVSFLFFAKSLFTLSENGPLGESPLLSRPYAAWDDGWRVFDAYANFSGTRMPSGWTPLGGWAGAVDNGLTVTAVVSMGAMEAPLPAADSSGVVVETSARANGSASPFCLFLAGSPGFNGKYQFFPSAYGLSVGANGTSVGLLETSNSSGAVRPIARSGTAPVSFGQSAHTLGLAWRAANATETGSVDGVPYVSQTDSTNGPMSAFGLGAYCGSNCSSWNVSWVRARSLPSPAPRLSPNVFAPVGVAAMTRPVTTDVGLPVEFSCVTSGSGGPFAFAWEFGDGSGGLGATASHFYMLPGSYAPTCNASGASGSAGSSSLVVVVHPDPAILLFQALPSAFPLGQSLNLVVNTTGGTAPFSFSYAGLPPGCPAQNTRTFSCLPGVTGTFAIEVIVEDAAHQATAAWITISVTAPVTPSTGTPFSPLEGYAIAGAVAGLIVVAGVVPVLVYTRRLPPGPDRSRSTRPPNHVPRRSLGEAEETDAPDDDRGGSSDP